MRWLALVLVVACGAQPAPAPRPAPIAKPVTPSAPPAPVSCGEAAVILRGKVVDERAAGPMKEEAIAKACLHDKWPPEIIECVGSDVHPRSCLDKLEPALRDAYRAKLAAWSDAFPDEPFDDLDPDKDEVDFVDCSDAVADVAAYAPPLALTGADRALAVAMRKMYVLELCEDWSTAARHCFEQTTPPDKCRDQLEPDQKKDLADRLAEVDALMARIAAVAKKPASLDCKKVVEAHYAEARWKGKLDTLKAPERKKLIADARAAMTKACTDDKWSASLRGCIVAQGGDACFTASGILASTWGLPPTVIPVKTGIAECDSYGDALRALALCPAIPKLTIQRWLGAFQQAAKTYPTISPAERAKEAQVCKQADQALRQSAGGLGCTI